MQNNLEKIKVVVQAKTGAELFSCIKDSIALAIELNIRVELHHNCQIFIADIESIVDDITTARREKEKPCTSKKV